MLCTLHADFFADTHTYSLFPIITISVGDPDPDPLVIGKDPDPLVKGKDPDPSII